MRWEEKCRSGYARECWKKSRSSSKLVQVTIDPLHCWVIQMLRYSINQLMFWSLRVTKETLKNSLRLMNSWILTNKTKSSKFNKCKAKMMINLSEDLWWISSATVLHRATLTEYSQCLRMCIWMGKIFRKQDLKSCYSRWLMNRKSHSMAKYTQPIANIELDWFHLLLRWLT